MKLAIAYIKECQERGILHLQVMCQTVTLERVEEYQQQRPQLESRLKAH